MIAAALLLGLAAATTDDVIVVTATRSEAPLRDQAGNTALIGADEVDDVAAVHAAELLGRAPGVWITRGSNQEHLTAIRSPILTGPGACGAFLFLEDGLPVRPAGFCNVNQLIELNTEQARRIEVVRGPGSALYGSNALHGMVNVITRSAHDGTPDSWLLDAGPDRFLRLRGSMSHGDTRLTALAVRDDGWRDASGQRQAKFNLRHDDGPLTLSASGTWLDQDVAAFIVGEDAYRDLAIARSNPTPDAFREMDAQRASLQWRHALGDWDASLRPFARRSRMSFLQHFIPGQPQESNGHHSFGLQWHANRAMPRGGRMIIGAEAERADIDVLQVQERPLTGPVPALNETRPAGRHYDFSVTATTAAAFFHGEWVPAEHWRMSAGIRAEHTHYRYENRMDAGNLREDGTACGFGGCIYNRPDDRSDDFTVFTPKLGTVFRLADDHDLYLSVVQGHRAPQVHELYRLQRGQDVADLRPERMDAVELGWRGFVGGGQFDLAVFTMRKRAVVFQDSAGFSVSDGRTRHRGVELSWVQPLGAAFEFSLDGTLARHRYDFDRAIAGGETIVRGAEVQAAPRRLASARLAWRPTDRHRVELEAAHTGAHWLDASNLHRYEGHTLLHLRGRHDLGERWTFGWRLTNLTDRRYAERADFAFGNHRYFPGPPRSLWVTVGHR